MKTHIRPILHQDRPAVLEIENLCFPNPWTEEEFIKALRERNTTGLVAEQGETVVGFVIYSLYRDCIAIRNLAVLPRVQRRGVGSSLLLKLESELHRERRSQITALIREENLDAHLFFAASRYRAVEVHRDYWEEDGIDAYEFQFHVEDLVAS